jgi:hypothetical protein
VLAALAAVVVADLTGLSKAEVERLWLPFAVWLVVPCALLLRPRAQSMSERPTPPGGGFSVRTQSMSERPTPPGGGFSVRTQTMSERPTPPGGGFSVRTQGMSERPTPPGGGFSVRTQSMSERPTPPGGGFSVRMWLVAQAVLALAVNHLLLTVW